MTKVYVQLTIEVMVPKCPMSQWTDEFDTCSCGHRVVNHSYSGGCLLCGEEKIRKQLINVPDIRITNE